MILRIIGENVKDFPLLDSYSFVEVNDLEVLKKHEAFDIVNWAKEFNQFVPAKHFIMANGYVFPLVKSGKFYQMSGDVKQYQVIEGEVLQTYLPDEMNEEETLSFWEHILQIP
jgi:hypothetical protein